MGQRNDWMQRISEQMNLSMEPLPGIPLIELSGNERALIENHRGIVYYGTEKICIKVKFGYVAICGERLELAYMTSQKIVISGKIDAVTLSQGGSK